MSKEDLIDIYYEMYNYIAKQLEHLPDEEDWKGNGGIEMELHFEIANEFFDNTQQKLSMLIAMLEKDDE